LSVHDKLYGFLTIGTVTMEWKLSLRLQQLTVVTV